MVLHNLYWGLSNKINKDLSFNKSYEYKLRPIINMNEIFKIVNIAIRVLQRSLPINYENSIKLRYTDQYIINY